MNSQPCNYCGIASMETSARSFSAMKLDRWRIVRDDFFTLFRANANRYGKEIGTVI